MKVETRRDVFGDGATINVFSSGIGVLLQGITAVFHGGRAGDFVSLRFYRNDCSLGYLSLTVVVATTLVTELESLGVETPSDFDVAKVA